MTGSKEEVPPPTRHGEDVQVPHPADVLQTEVTDLRAPPARVSGGGVRWWCQVMVSGDGEGDRLQVLVSGAR